eukprot:13556000-Alexandrium_andersonii.AAC.1
MKEEVCVLRSVLALRGAGGAFYSARIQEPVARSGIDAGIDEDCPARGAVWSAPGELGLCAAATKSLDAGGAGLLCVGGWAGWVLRGGSFESCGKIRRGELSYVLGLWRCIVDAPPLCAPT